MKLKVKTLMASALTLAVAPAAASANVVWDYVVTGITCTGTCGPMFSPYIAAELILPGPTSSGSVAWQFGYPAFPGDPPPAHTGDSFVLVTNFGPRISGDDLVGSAQGGSDIRHYELSWDETDGVLDKIDLAFDAKFDSLRLSLSGGTMRTDRDGSLGCYFNSGLCTLEGSWVDPPGDWPQLLNGPAPVPEPSTWPLLLAGTLGMLWLRPRQSPTAIPATPTPELSP